jgi:hypothetical protein
VHDPRQPKLLCRLIDFAATTGEQPTGVWDGRANAFLASRASRQSVVSQDRKGRGGAKFRASSGSDRMPTMLGKQGDDVDLLLRSPKGGRPPGVR